MGLRAGLTWCSGGDDVAEVGENLGERRDKEESKEEKAARKAAVKQARCVSSHRPTGKKTGGRRRAVMHTPPPLLWLCALTHSVASLSVCCLLW